MKRPGSRPPDRSQGARKFEQEMATPKPLAGKLGGTQVASLETKHLEPELLRTSLVQPWVHPKKNLGLGSEPRAKGECKPERHWGSTDPPESPLPLGRAPEDHGTSLWRSSMHSPLASRRTTRPCLKTSKKQIKTPKKTEDAN